MRGRVHIFKYLSRLDEQGVEPQVLQITPAVRGRTGRGGVGGAGRGGDSLA